jgi:predicted nuclease of predicted toxin-antitoxin system
VLKLFADEHIPTPLIEGLLTRQPDLDIVTVQDAGLRSAPDPELLEWAAQEQRLVIPNDVNTLLDYAYQRVAEGKPIPGVIAVPVGISFGRAIEDVLMLAIASRPDEWDNQVIFLPL